MAAKKPAKPVSPPVRKPLREPRAPMSPEAKAKLRRTAINVVAAGLFSAVCVTGFMASKRYVEKVERRDAPPAVTLVGGPPVWMNATIHEQILAAARSDAASLSTDRQALAGHAIRLSDSPWVKGVKSVRRVYGEGPGDTIEIEAVYRTPVALVHWHEGYWYVDAEGVRLPEKFNDAQVRQMTAAGGRPLFRVLENIASGPAAVGKAWPGKDIKAGLELVNLLADKGYADQIVRIDVANYDGRLNANESQINLLTRYGTQVRWGQPPSSTAFFVEQKVDRKLEVMQQACRQSGRVDMNLPWIDLRFDNATVPSQQRASLDVGR